MNRKYSDSVSNFPILFTHNFEKVQLNKTSAIASNVKLISIRHLLTP
ncbi:hypothetical protein LC605_29235 [Nostoc sp. CHAB 5836]|nr:hypothetical protein [Nostoc sp. CHAB 5836]